MSFPVMCKNSDKNVLITEKLTIKLGSRFIRDFVVFQNVMLTKWSKLMLLLLFCGAWDITNYTNRELENAMFSK